MSAQDQTSPSRAAATADLEGLSAESVARLVGRLLRRQADKCSMTFANESEVADFSAHAVESWREALSASSRTKPSCLTWDREVRLSASDRIDALVGPQGVGVEFKVDGARSAVIRQLGRYAKSERVAALLLVTTRTKHLIEAPDVLGKPLVVCNLGGVLS